MKLSNTDFDALKFTHCAHSHSHTNTHTHALTHVHSLTHNTLTHNTLTHSHACTHTRALTHNTLTHKVDFGKEKLLDPDLLS